MKDCTRKCAESRVYELDHIPQGCVLHPFLPQCAYIAQSEVWASKRNEELFEMARNRRKRLIANDSHIVASAKYGGTKYLPLQPKPMQFCYQPSIPVIHEPDVIAVVQKRHKRVRKRRPKVKAVFQAQSAEEVGLITFMNADEKPIVGEVAGNNVFSEVDGTTNTDIGDFFSRPVRIYSTTWNESDAAGTLLTAFNPWSAWANNAYVKNKLNNYSWFRGDLNLKIQMTASPFYYGLLKFTYRPLQNFHNFNIANGSGLQKLIPYSQQPHVDLVPGDNDAFNFKIPFINPANWVNIQSASAMSDMGEVRPFVYAPLQSANAVTGSGIGITVYAWIDNIQLSGASIGYAMQSDEFGEGCVSKPASWVATAASYLQDIPVIGPFATATMIGASAISSIASLFGFTNVPVISDAQPVRNEPFPQMATSEIGYPIQKLALDPKNELSVDPRIIGINSGVDEMSISYLAGKESWLTTANWTTANLIDDTLFFSRINPNQYDTDDSFVTNATTLYMPPMAWLSRAFKSWRGSIIYRFHVVSSKYHKGKLRISFDPSGYAGQNIGGSGAQSNVIQTAIIDIGESNDVEMVIPYQQRLQFLALRNPTDSASKGWSTNTTLSTFAYDGDYDNGYITLRVLTPLTAPVDPSTVKIMVYVRCGEDFELANPSPIDEDGKISLYAPQSMEVDMSIMHHMMHVGTMHHGGKYKPQSAELSETLVSDEITLGKTGGTADHQYQVHFGENVRSIRQLMHRFELSSIEMIPVASTTASTYNTFQKYFYKIPRYPGYTSNSNVSATKLNTPGSYGYNFTNMTYMNWFSNAFLAYRGSTNWSFNVANSEVRHLRVLKDNTGSVSARVSNANTDINTAGTATASKMNALISQQRNAGSCGCAVTDQKTNAGLTVNCPNFSRYKFQSTNIAYANTGSATDGSDLDAFVLIGDFPFPSSTTIPPVVVSTYNSAGVDFGLYFFVNVPAVYVYSSAPAPI